MLLWGAAPGDVCSSLSPNWGCLGRTGWGIPPWGIVSYETLHHPHPTGCGDGSGWGAGHSTGAAREFLPPKTGWGGGHAMLLPAPA